MDSTIRVTVALAATTTLCLLLIATPIAWWLSRRTGLVRDIVTALIAMPIVLPPTVLGFYLLVAMGPRSPLMALLHPFGVRTLDFSFTGLVIGSIIYSLPFAVQPIRNAFEAIGPRPFEVAATLRAGPWDRFVTIALPLARKGFLTATVLVFAHTVGEFGVVLMIGGAIPGKTEVVSVRIYDLVEQLDWPSAHRLAGGLLVFAFLSLLSLLVIDRRWTRVKSAGVRRT
ncbi:MAG: molybdate ABC transporter permease subunit [Asticcacaulis sp.]